MNKYIEKSNGIWNNPSITSKTVGNSNGYIPIYRGGCFAIIPNNDNFVFFGEDDDHYWETIKVSKNELLNLQNIYNDLNNEIKVKIDYIKGISKQTYKISKNDFINKNRSLKNWIVKVTDRGKSISPLVTINENNFDAFHVKERLEVINKVLNILEDENAD